MSRVWVSRIMGGAASVALAAALLATPLAAGPPDCATGSCPTGTVGKSLKNFPYLARLLHNVGIGRDAACEPVAIEIQVISNGEGVSLIPVDAAACASSRRTCPAGVTACAATGEVEIAPWFSPCEDTVAFKIDCVSKCNAKCKAACSKTACSKSVGCKEVCAKTCDAICAKAKCGASACSTAVCSKSASCASACAKAVCAKAACCKTACDKNACAVACSKTACGKTACSTSACSKTACSKNACSNTSTCAKAACSACVCAACPNKGRNVCSNTACSNTACDKTAACESAACGKLCGVIELDHCEVAGDETVSRLWQMATTHCPLFNGHGRGHHMVPAEVAELKAQVARLETLAQAHEFIAQQREAMMSMVLESSQEVATARAETTETVASVLLESMEARAKAAEENLAQYRRIIEEAAEVHVTNATLQAKLEAAESKLELMHALARLQSENDRLKQQLAQAGGQSDSYTAATCPLTKTSARTSGECWAIGKAATPAPTVCSTADCERSQPKILPAPPARRAAAETRQYMVQIRLCQGEDIRTAKQLACPTIATTAGGQFSFISGGVIQASGTAASLPLGTEVQGSLGACNGETVELNLSIQHRVRAAGTKSSAQLIAQQGGQITGSVPLGKPVTCSLGQYNGQHTWLEVTVEPVHAPEVAEQR